MIINVTAEHIRKGKQRASTCCPVALALTEQWPDWTFYVSDLRADCYSRVGIYERVHFTNPQVGEFIRDYDNYGPSHVSPFSFEFEGAKGGGA